MKNSSTQFLHFLLSLSLMVASTATWAQAELIIEKQKTDCAKSASSEWSASLNKCVEKVTAKQARNEANDCNAITVMAQREACHIALAEKKTGLSSDPNSLHQGNTTGSMLMNAAYSVISLINFTGAKGKKSTCTSKTIFGVTAVAGLASDFYLKFQAKKKVKELGDKYKIDTKNGASDAQIKALEYLKEEQNTVAEIASLEKKRNMLLMMGYGAAGVMAAWEMTPYGKNPGCETGLDKSKPDEKVANSGEATGSADISDTDKALSDEELDALKVDGGNR